MLYLFSFRFLVSLFSGSVFKEKVVVMCSSGLIENCNLVMILFGTGCFTEFCMGKIGSPNYWEA